MEWVFSFAGLLLLLFILIPLVATIFASSPGEFAEGVSDKGVLASLWITFLAAFIATMIALVLGVPLAYLLARRDFPGKNLVQGLIDLPIIIPHTAAGVALLMVFGRRGVLGEPLQSLGIYFTENMAGIVVAMLFVSLPILVDTARESIAMVDERLERVARTLGAGPLSAFRRVTLPLARRGILGGAVLMWARGISEFGAVVILAYNPKAISVLVYERFAGFGLSAALPITILLLALALVILVVTRTLLLPRKKRGDGR
ncbi:MAG: ABC transporter permease [Thermoleophilia bacterium]|nr:ABC transporter permease [Thermoleophilia bacterium]